MFTLNDRFVLNLGWKKYFFTVRPGMLDILLFLLYFPPFFFSLVTTAIVSYMLSSCKGREVSFNTHVIFIIGSMSPLFDNADFVWRNTILTLQLQVFPNGGGSGCGEARVALMPPVADPGEGPGGPSPLFLDQTEARRVKKKIKTRPPPNLRVCMTPPHPPYLKVWIRRWPRWDYLRLP